MKKMWNRVQVAMLGSIILVVVVVTVTALLPWRICKAVIEAAMDWAEYDAPNFGWAIGKIAKALMAGSAPNYSRKRQ